MYTRLQPILFVRDVETECDFYIKLGFKMIESREGFAAIAYGEDILFGLEEKSTIDPNEFGLHAIWQIGVDGLDAVFQICKREKIEIIQEPELQEWGEWILKVRSPNGFTVSFEGLKL